MKRFFCMMSIYALFLCIPIEAKEETFKYKIYSSSKKESLLESKRQTVEILNTLLEGIEEESYKTMVKENLHLFEYEKEVTIKVKGNILYIIYGDGKGETITGEYEKENVCYEEVQPKSLLQEWFSKK